MRVLIEGPDLSGKTTLMVELKARLDKMGLISQDLHESGCSNKSLRRLLSRFSAASHPRNRYLNAAYILCGLTERTSIAKWTSNGCSILLCETHVDRAICYGEAIGLKPAPQIALAVSSLFPRFDLAVLLVPPYKERLRRLGKRLHANPVDRATCLDESTHLRFITAYRRALSRHYSLLEYDTSISTAQTISEYISSRIASTMLA